MTLTRRLAELEKHSDRGAQRYEVRKLWQVPGTNLYTADESGDGEAMTEAEHRASWPDDGHTFTFVVLYGDGPSAA